MPETPTLFQQLARADDDRAVARGAWARRAIVALFAVAVALVLSNQIGQQPSDSRAAAAAATLSLSAPHTVRGGLLFQSRIEIRARRAIRAPQLVLERGWFEGIQVDSIEPDPSSQSGRPGGKVTLSFDQLDAGQSLTVWIQSQVDPTDPGRRPAGVALTSGGATLASISRTITVLP
jgi:hypothetical protein